MDIARYGELAVDLANTWDEWEEREHLPDVTALQQWIGEHLGLHGRVHDADLATVRQLRTQLRAVFDADEARAVALLNELMERYPVRPAISGHDGRDWHLHLAESDRPVGELVAAAVSFGLSAMLLDVGFGRRGTCAEDRCEDAFVDTSRNRSRRYCSTTCSTRANVAAYRARQRGEAGEQAAQPS